MTIAELLGKLRPHESMEDLLTSDVFGAARYLHPDRLLVPALQQAWNSNTSQFLQFPLGVDSATYEFWPWTGSSEPDVVIRLFEGEREVFIVLIEAKYFSGKSSFVEESLEPGGLVDEGCSDQLAREYIDLIKLAGGQPHALVYLTRYGKSKAQDITEAVEELRAKGKQVDSSRVFTLDWSSFWAVADSVSHELIEPEKLIVMDLRDLLHRKNLSRFRSIEAPRRHGFAGGDVRFQIVGCLHKRTFSGMPTTKKNAFWRQSVLTWSTEHSNPQFPLLSGDIRVNSNWRHPVLFREHAHG